MKLHSDASGVLTPTFVRNSDQNWNRIWYFVTKIVFNMIISYFQVSCLDDVCGLLPFRIRDVPDQSGGSAMQSDQNLGTDIFTMTTPAAFLR